MRDVVRDSLCVHLFAEAERVRWRMQDVPWHRIDREQAGPGLRALVTEMVHSELTTTTATRRFLNDLSDDPDFTQWVSVWFYEETKHPQVLLGWLHHVGVTVDEGFLLRGRATAPLMRSRMGTFVTNVISEMFASAAYASLCANSSEPVLAGIALRLAADEARHAASFYAYARRHLLHSPDPDADRRDALKVLYLWFQDSERVSHPVNEFFGRAERRAETRETLERLAIDRRGSRERILRVVGTLVGLPLHGGSDLAAHVRDLGPALRPDGGPR